MKTKKLIFAALFAALDLCCYHDHQGTDTYHGLYPSRWFYCTFVRIFTWTTLWRTCSRYWFYVLWLIWRILLLCTGNLCHQDAYRCICQPGLPCFYQETFRSFPVASRQPLPRSVVSLAKPSWYLDTLYLRSFWLALAAGDGFSSTSLAAGLASSASGVPFNIVQGLFGVILSTILYPLLKKPLAQYSK